TLRATIDWSYDLLDEDERTAFTALAVFADGADLDAVEAITRAGPGSLAALVAKNLVVRREMSDHRTRLRLLETVREYAAERLAGAVGLFLGFQRGQLGEVRGWLEAALRTASEAPLRLRAKACLALAVALQNLGESEHALGYCGQAVGLYRRSGDRAGLAQSL